jgi:hypothetical protein
MAADQAQKTADPDYNPPGLDQTADLAAVHPMSHYCQRSIGVFRCSPAKDAE